jgi:hypothetical protein
MSTNAYPINAPVIFTGTGAVFFANTGAIDFNNQTVTDFVTSVTGSTFYVGSGGAVTALPIGTAGQYLQVNSGANAPQWVTLASEGPIFSAFSTASATAITGSNTWQTLTDTYLTWDMSAPGVTGASFDPTTGEFTVSDAGVYEFACSVAFQGNNSATPGLLSSVPAGLASRQVALQVNSTEVTFSAAQAEPSNSNRTQVAIYNAKLSLAPADVVTVAVRHDASTPLIVGGDARTSFSGSRVR